MQAGNKVKWKEQSSNVIKISKKKKMEQKKKESRTKKVIDKIERIGNKNQIQRFFDMTISTEKKIEAKKLFKNYAKFHKPTYSALQDLNEINFGNIP